ARKPSTVRWRLEMWPSRRSFRRMYLKPLACRPFCCLGMFEKSWVGIGGHRGSSHSHTSGGVGVARSSPSANRVIDQLSMSVSSGPNGRKRYEDALLYIGSTK